MPNFNSTKAAAQAANTVPVKSGISSEVIVDNIALATAHAQADTVTLVKLPKGFLVTGIGYSVSAKPGATSGVYQFGDGTTAARFGTTSAISAAAQGFFAAVDQTALTADTNLVLTLSTLTGGAAAHNIFVQVYGTFNP
jgi:hypothetical protein